MIIQSLAKIIISPNYLVSHLQDKIQYISEDVLMIFCLINNF